MRRLPALAAIGLLALPGATWAQLQDLGFRDGFEAPVAQQPDPPESEMPVPVDCPATPAGFTVHELSWSQAFRGNTYPSSGAPLVPIGSFSLTTAATAVTMGPPIAGKIITIPFTPGRGVYRLSWLAPQPIWEHGYLWARPGTPYITVSRCPGDVRLPAELDQTSCGKYTSNGSLFYSSTRNGSTVCPVVEGEQYYLTFVFENPWDGLNASADSCANLLETRCETNTLHERQSAD